MINSLKDDVIACLLTVGTVLSFMYVVKGPASSVQPTELAAKTHNEIVVKAGDYQSHYSLLTPVNEAFLVAAVYPQKHRRHPVEDFDSQFVTFSPKATRSYMKKYAGKKNCPASFLNRHAEHISLYAANPQIAKTLAEWTQKNGSDVSKWSVMNIRGQCLGKRTKIELEGQDVTHSTRIITIGRKASRDCHMIYVTDISQAHLSVEDYFAEAL